ncbi:MAG: hypothetical protein ACRCVN_02965 [Spirochaetia bacterium]
MSKNMAILFSLALILLQINVHAQTESTTLPPAEVPVIPSQFLADTKPTPIAHVLPLLQEQFKIPAGMFPNPIGISLVYNYTTESYNVTSFKGEPGALGSAIGLSSIGIGKGVVDIQSHAIGLKFDTMLLPFLQIFGLAAYITMNQTTTIEGLRLQLKPGLGGGIIPVDMTIPIENSLEGFIGMGGMNMMFGYKGFFLSFMLSGGLVRLDDNINNVKGFVSKPIMYVAPRIGYQYKGIFNIFTGVQYIALFGATQGADLSALTGGLVKSFEVGLEKFPVNFVVGCQFTPIREFSIGLEYVGSPGANGVNIEIGGRF